MKKLLLTAIAMAAVSTPAHADIFKYTQTNGDILTINTDTNAGSLVGRNINATFRSSDFANFSGGADVRGTFVLDSLNGSVTNRRGTFAPNKSHTQKLIFSKRNGTLANLWSYWGPNNEVGDYITRVRSYTPPAQTGSTSTGGSTGGATSTGGSTGGATSSSTGGTSTSTGGSTGGGTTSSTGGTTSSTGGTDVPAPGGLLLFGLAAAGMFGGRRAMAKRKSA